MSVRCNELRRRRRALDTNWMKDYRVMKDMGVKIHKEQLICTDGYTSGNHSLDPEEGLMDLHDGSCCVLNPAYQPKDPPQETESDDMLEAKELMLRLMQAVAQEAKQPCV